jgi:hypothetical protein
MDDASWAAMLTAMRAAWPHDRAIVDPAVDTMYRRALGRHDPGMMQAAIDTLSMSSPRFPSIAQFAEVLRGYEHDTALENQARALLPAPKIPETREDRLAGLREQRDGWGPYPWEQGRMAELAVTARRQDWTPEHLAAKMAEADRVGPVVRWREMSFGTFTNDAAKERLRDKVLSSRQCYNSLGDFERALRGEQVPLVTWTVRGNIL